MAERITLRNRGRGSAASNGESPPAVSIADPRTKFVEGSLDGLTGVKCGDGSRYPFEVSLDQLSQISTRVKDSVISWGGMTADYSYTVAGVDVSGTVDVNFKGGSPPVKLAESETGIVYDRTSGGPSSGGSLETARAGQCINEVVGGGTDHPTDKGGALGELYYINIAGTGKQARDPLTEHSMWIEGYSAAVFTGSKLFRGASFDVNILGTYAPSGMSQYSRSFYANSTTDVAAGFYGIGCDGVRTLFYGVSDPRNATDESYYRGSVIRLEISEVVAFIDVTGSGDPYDSGNRLFMNAVCEVLSAYTPLLSGGNLFQATTQGDLSGSTSTTAVAKLILSGGVEIAAPLYFVDDNANTLNLLNLEDIVITATDWWPYAKTDQTPAWDAATGLPIGDPSS